MKIYGEKRCDRNIAYHIGRITPFICAMVVFKATTEYYYLLFPSVSSIISIAYQIITLFCFCLFPVMLFRILFSYKYNNLKIFRPEILIPFCVLANIAMVMIEEGNFNVLSRSYIIPNALFTNDYYGFYFAQLNTWFGNIGIILFLTQYVDRKKQLIKCIIHSLIMFIIPIILLIIMHPEYIGLRESMFNDIVFGGGIWNIGIYGFGSLAWIAIAQIHDVNKNQKKIIILSIFLFCFAGIAGLSRTFVLMLAFSVAFFLGFSRKNITWIKTIFIIIVFTIIFILFENGVVSEMVARFKDKDTSGTNNVRFVLWESYFRHVKEYFWLGAPSGSIYNYYLDTSFFGKHFLPHSAILNFLIRFGIVSVIAYLLMIKNVATKLVKKDDTINKFKSICLKAWVISYISLGFINQTGFGEIVFYLGFGLIFSMIKIENSDNFPLTI